jgi:hypothetical protein
MNSDNEEKIAEDFIILCDSDPEGLTRKVSQKLDEGYQLHGSPFVFKEAICQAMTFGRVSSA